MHEWPYSVMDMEFEKVKDLVPLVEGNTTAAREHVGLIERALQHLKEKIRATISEFPFMWIPILVLIQTVSIQLRILDKCIPELLRDFWVVAP